MNDLQTQNQEILTQKKEAWGQMGVAVYQAEQSLSLEAQQALNDIVLPSKIEDVPLAEETLKEVKKALQTVTAKRKEITSKFDDVTARLMAPEKSFADPIKQLSDSIISVKKAHQIEQDKFANINNEKTTCRTFYSNMKIRVEEELSAKLNNMVSRCYEGALNGDVTLETLAAYKSNSINAVNETHFGYTEQGFNPAYISKQEVEEIRNELFQINKATYVSQFAIDIEAKFSDYEVALNNKAQALENSKKEEQAKEAEISQKASQQEMAVKIEAAVSVPVVEQVATKALKQGFIVDMPETVESALTILAAFSANLNLCLPFLKVNKWFAFTPAQASTALGKVKCDDNNFAPSGIIFKAIDKL